MKVLRPLRRRQRRHLAYALIITALAILAGYKGVLPVFRSHLMAYLGIGDQRFGLLFGVGSLAGMVGVLVGGRATDRLGPRRVIRTCLAGVGVGMLLVAFGGARYASFLLATSLNGLFSAPLFIAVNAYLGRLFPRHRRRIISLNLASSSLGGMMFPAVAEGLLYLSRRADGITFAQTLHVPFVLVGGLLLAGSLIYRPRRPPRPHTPARHVAVSARGGPPGRMLPPRILVLTVLLALHGTADSTLHYWMPRFLESRSFAAQAMAPGIVLSGYAFAYVLSRGLLSTLPDRVGARAFLVWPGLLGGTLLLLGIASRSYMLTAVGYVAGAFFWSAEYPTMVSTVMRCDRQRFGSAMAAAALLGGPLLFASMSGIGMLVERWGSDQMWKIMLAPAAVFPMIGVGGRAWLRFFDREPAPATGRLEELELRKKGIETEETGIGRRLRRRLRMTRRDAPNPSTVVVAVIANRNGRKRRSRTR